jgi:hypothetical protein
MVAVTGALERQQWKEPCRNEAFPTGLLTSVTIVGLI